MKCCELLSNIGEEWTLQMANTLVLCTALQVKQCCVSNECISINDNLEVPGTFYIKWKEGERELTSGETESVHKEGHSV